MFRFIKKVLFTARTFFSCNELKCVSMNNQECKVRSAIINILLYKSQALHILYIDTKCVIKIMTPSLVIEKMTLSSFIEKMTSSSVIEKWRHPR